MKERRTISIVLGEFYEDIFFLEDRAMGAGGCDVNEDIRSVGASSNELVHFAYTGEHRNVWPNDMDDYRACKRAFESLPKHRQTKEVKAKLKECWKHRND